MVGAASRNATSLVRSPMAWYTAIGGPLAFFAGIYLATNASYDQRGLDAGLFVSTGLLVQVLVYCAINSAMTLSADLRSGMFMRIRSMPVSLVGFVGGRFAVDVIRNMIALASALMVVTVFRLVDVKLVGAVVIVIVGSLLGIAMSITYLLAITLPRSETAGVALCNCIGMPLVFLSTAYAPLEFFPQSLRPIVKAAPFTPVAEWIRSALDGSLANSFLATAIATWFGLGFVCLAIVTRRTRLGLSGTR